VDAINTDGTKAVHEVADLIEQVHASDPAQAQELFARTARGIGAEDRTRLEALFDGRGVEDLHIDGHPRRPERPSHTEWRTKEMTPEDKAKLEGLYNDKLHRPGQDKPEIMLLSAKADDGGTLSGSQAQETLTGGTGEDAELAQAPQLVPVPGYRSDVFKSPKGQKDWLTWQADVGKLSSASESEQRAYAEIFAAEGGMASDPTSSAASGIMQNTLDELVTKGQLPAAYKGLSPSSLSSEQRATVYRAYADHALSLAGGHKALGKLDAQSASALADTLFRHGREGGAEIVQNAINTVTPAAVKATGPVGPETFGAYQKLAADPATRKRLMDALADARKDTVKGKATAQAEAARFDHFRNGSAF